MEGNLTIEDITTSGLTSLSDIFPALDSVRGDLTIVNSRAETITGFVELDSIGGDIFIHDPSLTTISGFDVLATIAGSLNIGNRNSIVANAALTTLPTFSALKTIGNSLNINNNAALKSISGFDVLETINGSLHIGSSFLTSGNPLLTSLPPFSALKTIGGSLSILGNDLLTTISGFAALKTTGEVFISSNDILATVSGFDVLETINGSLHIGSSLFNTGNPLLKTLPTFSALKTIDEGFFIRGNDVLTTLPAFDVLKSIGQNLQIEGNAKLTTISGFGALTGITGDFIVMDNAMLSSCCGLLRIANNTVTVGGTTTIESNTAGCNSKAEIMTDCVVTTRTLTASPSSLMPTAAAGDVTFDVTANVPWAITQASPVTWITSISPKTGSDNQQITIEYEENTDPMQRMAVLTLSATDGSETTDITLTQAAATPPAVVGLPTLAYSLRFYPNPASHTLYIEGISQETNLIIRTLAGRTLLRTSLRQNQAVDIASLPQGVYLLTLQSSQETAQAQLTRRLVIGL